VGGSRCEAANRSGQPPQDCATDPGGFIAQAQQQAGATIAKCTTFGGLPGCATAGTAAGTTACVQALLAPLAPAFTGVAYP